MAYTVTYQRRTKTGKKVTVRRRVAGNKPTSNYQPGSTSGRNASPSPGTTVPARPVRKSAVAKRPYNANKMRNASGVRSRSNPTGKKYVSVTKTYRNVKDKKDFGPYYSPARLKQLRSTGAIADERRQISYRVKTKLATEITKTKRVQGRRINKTSKSVQRSISRNSIFKSVNKKYQSVNKKYQSVINSKPVASYRNAAPAKGRRGILIDPRDITVSVITGSGKPKRTVSYGNKRSNGTGRGVQQQVSIPKNFRMTSYKKRSGPFGLRRKTETRIVKSIPRGR